MLKTPTTPEGVRAFGKQWARRYITAHQNQQGIPAPTYCALTYAANRLNTYLQLCRHTHMQPPPHHPGDHLNLAHAIRNH